jgi:hypothetical protein
MSEKKYNNNSLLLTYDMAVLLKNVKVKLSNRQNETNKSLYLSEPFSGIARI